MRSNAENNMLGTKCTLILQEDPANGTVLPSPTVRVPCNPKSDSSCCSCYISLFLVDDKDRPGPQRPLKGGLSIRRKRTRFK